MLYYRRDICWDQSNYNDFYHYSIKEDYIDFFHYDIIPLNPSLLNRIDAKIIQWLANTFYSTE
ncbi:hypothetical protein [Volucribacter amazonae]|uniref:Uncharacterized protein n=1 Tax=Volucribacter amazonae TaxID=256731 RepID=A0A9X4P9B5_9PAST|nr:hypothetical protein [Volucribacter amazonae]MDG6894127.1 hypothetical protein [Volucribacter amazonae]